MSESELGIVKQKWTDERLRRLGAMVAEGRSDAEIADLFGCGRQAIGFQRRTRLRLAKPCRRPLRPLPADFRIRAPELSADECRRHYRCSARLLRRWYAETGLRPRTRIMPPPPPRPVAEVAPPSPRLVPPVPMTLERQAAHHLQRFGPTYACAVLTRRERALLPEGGDDRWMVHGRCLTTPEMLRAAAARGFPLETWTAE